ncbi:hypothetical protein [Streptomyces sp. NRRL S-350]|uniref:hypothetical protein n=1 Tax=Streptomyces sp. NRRL S-350 TaxID=1463902 RepID=UPI00131B503C|nr:hypothetical protein [Streptomyces sp. NRRL S-350]
MTQRRYEYAPAGSLPGLLQRGRGLGALMAAEDPSAAADLVHGCIRWDWRWNPRADDRSLYLARLVRDLGLPLGPVIDVAAAGEDAGARVVRILELLALGGSDEAAEALRAREASTPAARTSGAQARPHRGSPVAPSERPGREEREGPEGCPGGEGGRGPRPYPGRVEERDVPAMIAELEQHWVDRSWCGPGALASGLARFGPEAAGAVSLLRRFWLNTPHSSERPAYLEALAALGSPGTAEAYAESLWDCEARARLLGVEHAPDRPDVRARLARLRDDPSEGPEIRNAAAARLAGAVRGAVGDAREAVRGS